MSDPKKINRSSHETDEQAEGEVVATEPGGMYDTGASKDDITPNNETMSKSPGNKPSQAEGSRSTVEQDLGQKNQDT